MVQPYTSTACRVGSHRECRERRIVPNCACRCHEQGEPEPEDGEPA